MTSQIQKTTDGTIEFTITIPWSNIQDMYKTVISETASSAEIAGFRKGKAPEQIVEETADKTKIYEETIKRLVPKAYTEAVTEHGIKPIMMPQIELKEANEEKDWVISAKTCERPTVQLKEYKKAIADLKNKKQPKIIVPGKETGADDQTNKITVDEVLDAILGSVEGAIPDILLEHEVTHQLSQLVDQTKKLGLTVEQYLSSTGKSADSVREEYREQARKNLTLEFGLEAIADKENITVSEEEINKLLATAKSEEERTALSNQRYYLSSLIRRQKTVDTLMA